jgi:hypothetical protein
MNANTVSVAGEMLMAPADKTECKNVYSAARRKLAKRDLSGGGNELHID